MRTAVNPVKRFWEKVDLSDPLNCWEWTGALHGGGYGRLGFPDRSYVPVHRFSYLIHGGVIPEGHVLDHLCRNRPCVRPDHLEPVTLRENLDRGITPKSNLTQCKNGHEFTVDNTAVNKRGNRQCRECQRAANRRAYRKAHVPPELA